MTDHRREVDELRQEIGKLDVTLRAALERRAKLSRTIGDLQKDTTTTVPLPEREQIERILEGATGDMPRAALREIFREIVAACASLEHPAVVAYCGVPGAFAHAAARSRFGASAEFHACEGVAGTLDEVTRKHAGFAVVPIETRTDGLLASTIAALSASDLKIIQCFETSVNLQLVSKAGALTEIEKVYATAEDRASAARFLAQELPGAEVLLVKSPMAACQLAASDPRASALALASIASSEGLEVLKGNVRDEGDERVRYAVIGTRPRGRSGNDLTAIVFAVNDSPGALHEILRQFAERGVNLTKIQSRPVPGEDWQYAFFAEVQGHATDRPIVGAIEELRRSAKSFKVLGSYTVT